MYLYYDRFKKVPESSIVSFVSGKNKPFVLSGSKLEVGDLIRNYPVYLGKILESVFDPNMPFEHQVKGQFSYCDFCE